jgi:hypothetical protein
MRNPKGREIARSPIAVAGMAPPRGSRMRSGSGHRSATRRRIDIPMTSRVWYFSIEPRRRVATTVGARNAEQEEGD